MAKLNIRVQQYPRISDEQSPFSGMLDESKLVSHSQVLSKEELYGLILSAINDANRKSSRAILTIPQDASELEISTIYQKEGKELFKYFKKYCGDPASTAHQIYNKHYREVGIEQFRNRTLQKERMNSGWRYQFLVLGCARKTQRFLSVSDLGGLEADFHAVVEYAKPQVQNPLSLYVSVKNRSNTMGGQDWPKAIQALEQVASSDKNRTGDYCCVFGIGMERGFRYIKREQKTKKPHSYNTEVWLSDFFWPFFTNFSYEEIMQAVLEVLVSHYSPDQMNFHVEVPDGLLQSFGANCKEAGLVNENGFFDNPRETVKFFCK